MEEVVRFRNNGDILYSTRRTDMVSYDPNNGDLGIRGMSHLLCLELQGITYFVQREQCLRGWVLGRNGGLWT